MSLESVLPVDAKGALDKGEVVYFYDPDMGAGLFFGSPNARYRRLKSMEVWDPPSHLKEEPNDILREKMKADPVTYEDSSWIVYFTDGKKMEMPTPLGDRVLGGGFFKGHLTDDSDSPQTPSFRKDKPL
jgi:hypothetical protein